MRRLLALFVVILATPVAAYGQCPTPTPTPTSTPTATPTPTVSPTPTATPPPPTGVFYVSPTGSDTAAGSEAAPWRTLNASFAKLDPGETLKVRGGTYLEDLAYSRAGTATSPITVENYAGETPTVDGATREAMRVQATAAHTTFRGLIFQDTPKVSGQNYQDIYVVNGAHHILLQRNVIRWTRGGTGIFVDNQTDHIDLIGNLVYENNEPGVQHQGIYHEGSNSTIARNVVYGHTNGFGIQVKTGADHIDLSQNTTADNSLSGILVMDTADHITVRNNISAFNGGYGIRTLDDGDNDGGYTDCTTAASLPGSTPAAKCANTASNNLLFNNTSGACVPHKTGVITCGTQLPAADPRFRDRIGRDYRLVTVDPNPSPAIDKALTPWYWPDPDGISAPRGLQGLADVGGFESG